MRTYVVLFRGINVVGKHIVPMKELKVLLAPDGIGRSKLAAGIDACLDVPTTARNLNTVRKLLQLAAPGWSLESSVFF